jgi:AmiR/NasT family two-component response regulator
VSYLLITSQAGLAASKCDVKPWHQRGRRQMDAAHARVAKPVTTGKTETKSPATSAEPAAKRPIASPRVKLRVLLAERRATVHSELAKRLEQAGHEVLARVTSKQGALDYAELLRPDVVLLAPILEDGPGVMAALALTRELPGIAAVVLTTHPAATDPAARPNWGAVAVVPADAESADLDAELRRAVGQARDLAAYESMLEHERSWSPANGAAADSRAMVPAPQCATPSEQEPVTAIEVVPVVVPARMPPNASMPAPAPDHTAQPAVAAAPVAVVPEQARLRPPATPPLAPRPVLSFTDEDLITIGPFVDSPDSSLDLRKLTPPAAVIASAPSVPSVPCVPSVPSAPSAPSAPSTQPSQQPVYDSDTEVITQAAECLLERTGLSRSDAMRLMEQEAADTDQRLVDVAYAVLGRDGTPAVDGAVALTA